MSSSCPSSSSSSVQQQMAMAQDQASPTAHSAPLIPLRQCRICLLSSESRRKPLISPCRCAGSVQHVHVHCLAHWIEVSSRKLSPPPHCELCGFRYRRRPFVNPTRMHLPFMDVRDRVLNGLCLLLLLIMGLCAWVAVQHLQKAEKRPATMATSSGRSKSASRVAAFSQADLTVLVALLLMFSAFFLALFTQYRAELTICRAIGRLWATNRNWQIRNYCPELGHEDRGGGKGRRSGPGRLAIMTGLGRKS